MGTGKRLADVYYSPAYGSRVQLISVVARVSRQLLTACVPGINVFRVMRDESISGTTLEGIGLETLANRLPPGWVVKRVDDSRPSGRQAKRGRPDALLEIRGPDGKRARVVVAVKAALEPRAVRQLVEDMRAYRADGALVVAPFVSVRARELLRERGCGYADPTGNLWLCISSPGLFVESTGAAKDPTRIVRPLRSLKGPAAGRAVRALCDLKPPFRVRELALRAQVPLATLARVIDLLVRDALVERDPTGAVLRVDWEKTIRRWAEDYSLARSNHVRTFLDPRGLPALREKLARLRSVYAVTGSLAAAMVAPIAAPRLAQIYVQDTQAAADTLELRATEAGANAMLVEPYDDVVFERGSRQEGIVCAAWPQVAVDLMTGPGTGPKEADALLAWMAEPGNVWRA